MRATYRATPTSPPVPCEVIGEKPSGKMMCRQVGRPLPGVWLARPEQIAPPVRLDVEDLHEWLRRNLQSLGAL